MVHVGSKFWYVVLVVPETTKPLTTFRDWNMVRGLIVC